MPMTSHTTFSLMSLQTKLLSCIHFPLWVTLCHPLYWFDSIMDQVTALPLSPPPLQNAPSLPSWARFCFAIVYKQTTLNSLQKRGEREREREREKVFLVIGLLSCSSVVGFAALCVWPFSHCERMENAVQTCTLPFHRFVCHSPLRGRRPFASRIESAPGECITSGKDALSHKVIHFAHSTQNRVLNSIARNCSTALLSIPEPAFENTPASLTFREDGTTLSILFAQLPSDFGPQFPLCGVQNTVTQCILPLLSPWPCFLFSLSCL